MMRSDSKRGHSGQRRSIGLGSMKGKTPLTADHSRLLRLYVVDMVACLVTERSIVDELVTSRRRWTDKQPEIIPSNCGLFPQLEWHRRGANAGAATRVRGLPVAGRSGGGPPPSGR